MLHLISFTLQSLESIYNYLHILVQFTNVVFPDALNDDTIGYAFGFGRRYVVLAHDVRNPNVIRFV